MKRGGSWLARAALVLACGCSRGPVVPQPDLDFVEDEVAAAVAAAQAAVRAAPRDAGAWAGLGDRYAVHGWDSLAAECYGQAARLEPAAFLWPYLVGKSLADVDSEAAAAAFARALEIHAGYAPAHVRYAHSLVRLDRADEARRHFERAAELDPANAWAPLGLGQLELGAGRLEAARRWLEQAVASNPRLGETHRALARVYQGLGEDALARRHSNRAERLPRGTPLDDVRAERPVELAGSVQVSLRALALEREGRLEEAAELLRRAVRLNPHGDKIHYDLGSLAIRLEQLDEAVTHLGESIRLAPANVEAHFNLGYALLRQDKPEEAEACFREALRRDSDYAEAHFMLGLILSRRQETELAAASLVEARRLDPAYYAAQMGQLMLRQGRVADALAFLRSAVEADPDDAEARFRLGTLLARQGQGPEALEHLQAAVNLDPGFLEARVSLGFALLEAQQPAAAAGAFLAALDLRSEHAPANYGCALALERLGQTGQAIERLREAHRLEPDWPEPPLRLAWIRATDARPEFRDGAEAVELAERVVAAGERRAASLDVLAAAYAEADRFPDAARIAREALALARARQEPLAGPLAGRLELYEAGMPFRDARAP